VVRFGQVDNVGNVGDEFAESAIERSVAALERETGPLPDYAEGYRQWREAFDAGKAGVFAIAVAAALYAVTGILFPPNP
jgi:hypothetical protein